MSDRKPSLKTFLLGSLIGLVVGIIATLLYLPQTGKKLRQKIKRSVRKIKSVLSKLIDESESLSESCQNGWGKVMEVLSNLAEEEDLLLEEIDESAAPESSEVPTSDGPDQADEKDESSSGQNKKSFRFFKGI